MRSTTPRPMSAATVERKARPLSEWQKRRRAQRHVILAATHERALIADLNKVLRAIARSAAKLVEAGQYEQAQKVPNAYLSQLVRLFEGRLEATATASAQLVIEELTGNKSHSPFELKFFCLFEIAEAAIRLWISDYAAAKVVRIVETTRLRIRKSIERGNELNEPPRVLAKRIREETGGEIARRRAETIARTETGIAASVGADEAAQATNLQLDKRWVSTEDQRTRPTHHAANDQVRAMDKLFDVGGAKMRYPRDPNGPPQEVINCRCVVLYEPRIPK